jgi:hypothetical protein
MNHGQSIAIQLVDDDGKRLKLSDVLVEVHFFTKGDYRYGFKIGRTDDNGYLCVSYSEIEATRRHHREDNLMDFNTKLEDCDPMVKVVAPSRQNLQEQYDSAVRFYRAPPSWAKTWPANVNRHEAYVDLVDQTNTVQLRLDADEIPSNREAH